ncbi:DUF6002 family protein [Streptomyces sp. M10(2022)]
MVTSLLGTKVPDYGYDEGSGVWRQSAAPEFPGVTDHPQEVIDATFYQGTADAYAGQRDRRPARGGGVVVSRRECLDRFDQVRSLAAEAGTTIAHDPR